MKNVSGKELKHLSKNKNFELHKKNFYQIIFVKSEMIEGVKLYAI